MFFDHMVNIHLDLSAKYNLRKAIYAMSASSYTSIHGNDLPQV